MLRVYVAPGEPPAQFLLQGQDAVLGRSDPCDLVVPAQTVSGRHGIFRARPTGYTFTDLGSRNGSALRREGAEGLAALGPGEETPLCPGDELLLGAADRPVRVTLEAATSAFERRSRPTTDDRTVIAAQPLADLLAGPAADLAALAARAIAAVEAQSLVDAAYTFLRAIAPGAQAFVELERSAVAASRGEAPPRAIADAVRGQRQVTQLERGIASPLLARDSWQGWLALWELGRSAADKRLLDAVVVAAPLLGLAAGALASRLEAQRAAERAAPDEEEGAPIGNAPSFQRAVRLCQGLAGADIPIFIHGETGTGKEVVARAVHRWSSRSQRPFLAINCAAIPDTLFESQLFGHVRGAFTGASSDQPGYFLRAHRGTLLLDEIGEMPLASQAKLLRVLEDGEVTPVGGTSATRVDVRVLSASHQDLEQAVAEGRFREDLMYRLNTAVVKLPALRERPGDVRVLAHHFLRLEARRAQKRVLGFTPEALWTLETAALPGNVRQLRNEIAYAVALTPEDSPVRPSALSHRLQPSGAAPDPGQQSEDDDQTLKALVGRAERYAVELTLEREDGNMTRAAEALGLSRTGLYKTMERLGLRRGGSEET